MSRRSIAASLFLVVSVVGAAAYAATSEQPVRLGGDPVATLAIMAQLEKAGTDKGERSPATAEKAADANGNLHVPEDYRARYRFIGSWAVASDEGSGSKEIHTVYASPGAVEG